MKESDWKLLRKLKPVLLERLCEHILQECREAIAEEDESAHERYLYLCSLLRTRNDDVAICFDDHRRSNAILKVAAIYQRGLLEDEELAQFTEGAQKTVRALSTPVGGSA
jgi:transcription initiation factor IIE alpha subunit